MRLPHYLCRPTHTLFSSTPPISGITTAAATTIPISNWSHLYAFQAHPILFLTAAFKPISKSHPFFLYNSGSRFILRASFFKPPVNADEREAKEAIDLAKLKVLKQKLEVVGINCDDHRTPGLYNHSICPKCKGGQSMERSLSFHINQKRDFAMWRCFRIECGWAGQVFADIRGMHNGVNQISELNLSRQMTEESLLLEPLGNELIAYFAERMISKEVLQKNSVMQTSVDQVKGAEKILYGLDDIKEVDEIIIVEGEIDKLSMEQAGFTNCVSVPDGAPQKVSTKELPSLEKDTRFQYLWNCKEYLDEASRIILATDSDIPGQVLAEELARRLGRERCWLVSWPKKDESSCFKDANEVLKNMGSGALRDIVDNANLYRVQNSN